MGFTPEYIDTLPDDGIFVFGSNTDGDHCGGAALVALKRFGAVNGQAEGPQGRSYAIPTAEYIEIEEDYTNRPLYQKKYAFRIRRWWRRATASSFTPFNTPNYDST